MGVDERAVVDPQLRVLGVDALRVVDCSIEPESVCANTNASAYVIAAKAVDLILPLK